MLANNTYKNIFYLILTSIIIIAINLSSSSRFYRIDLSSAKLHSISENSKELIKSLENDEFILNAEVYFADNNFSAEVEKLRIALIEKLEEFKAYSNNNFRFKVIDMKEDEVQYKIESELRYKEGLAPCEIITQRSGDPSLTTIWPSMNLIMGEKQIPIQFLEKGRYDFTNSDYGRFITNQFISQIETKFIDALIKIKQQKKKNISFLLGHGELGDLDTNGNDKMYEIYDLMFDHGTEKSANPSEIRTYYDFNPVKIRGMKNEVVNFADTTAKKHYDSLIKYKIDTIVIQNQKINLFNEDNTINNDVSRGVKNHFFNEEIKKLKEDENNFHYKIDALKNTDLLIVASPKTKFTEWEKYIIDQYIMNGGKIIWLLDMFEINENLLKNNSTILAKPLEHDLANFLYDYGVRFNTNIVSDSKCAPVYRTDGLGIINDWFFYSISNMNPSNIFNNNIAPIKLRYPSTIDRIENDKNKSTRLLEPSDNYKIMRNTRITYTNTYNYNPINFENKDKNKPSFGWLIEGQFNSYFKDKPYNKKFEKLKSLAKFKGESIQTKMVFIGDGELIKNDILPDDLMNKNQNQPVPLNLHHELAYIGTEKFHYPYYGNEEFFLNLVDYMLEERASLIPLRSKTIIPKLLNKNATNDKDFWQVINLVFPILALLLFAITYWIIRKRKYGNK